jgi:uncharacterized membrane protein YphA (DoxX/SURF4 family)
MASANRNKITYWIFTVLFILPLAGSGIGFLTSRPYAMEGMSHLGYPVYIIRFLGMAKLLGVLAVLAGTFPKIKEWAYAGFVFNLLGAFYSHLSSGDGPKVFGPVVILSFTLLSYWYWKRSNLPARKSTCQSTEEPGVEVARAVS